MYSVYGTGVNAVYSFSNLKTTKNLEISNLLIFGTGSSVSGISNFTHDINVNSGTLLTRGDYDSGAFSVTGGVSFANDFQLKGDAYLNSGLNVTGSTLLSGNMTVATGAVSSFYGPANFYQEFNIESTLDVTGGDYQSGALSVAGGVSVAKSLQVQQDVDIGSKLDVTDIATFQSNVNASSLNVTGVSNLNNNLNVSGAASLLSILDVTAGNYQSGALIVAGGVSVANRLQVKGVITQSNVRINGTTTDVEFYNTANGTTKIGNSTKPVIINSDGSVILPYIDDQFEGGQIGFKMSDNNGTWFIDVNGENKSDQFLRIFKTDGSGTVVPMTFSDDGSMDLYYNTNINSNNDISITDYQSGALSVAGGVSVAKSLQVQQDVDIGSKLDVTGIATFQSNVNASSLNVTGSTLLSGNMTVATGAVSSFYGPANFYQEFNLESTLDVTAGDYQSGALSVAGGVSIAKNLQVQQNVGVANSLGVSGSTFLNGNITVATGAVSSFYGPANFYQEFNIESTLDVTGGDYQSGALSVAGGVSIAKNLQVQQNVGIGRASESALTIMSQNNDASLRIRPSATTIESSMGFYKSPTAGDGTDAWVIGRSVWNLDDKFGIGNFNMEGRVMTIELTGNVGIGTVTPNARMHVLHNQSDVGRLESSSSNAYMFVSSISGGSEFNGAYIGYEDNYPTVGHKGLAPTMRISSSSLGVGTSPNVNFSVNTYGDINVNSANGKLTFDGIASNNTYIQKNTNDLTYKTLGSHIMNSDSFNVTNAAGTTSKLYVNSDGLVGINNTSPVYMLHGKHNNRAIARFDTTTTGTDAYCGLQFYTASGSAEFGYFGGSRGLYLKNVADTGINNSQILLSASGYVGIGVFGSSFEPTSALHVVGNRTNTPSAVGVHIGFDSTGSYGIEICGESSLTGQVGTIDFTLPNNEKFGRLMYAHTGGAFVDHSMYMYTDNSEVMRVNTNDVVSQVGLHKYKVNSITGSSYYNVRYVDQSNVRSLMVSKPQGLNDAPVFIPVDGYKCVFDMKTGLKTNSSGYLSKNHGEITVDVSSYTTNGEVVINCPDVSDSGHISIHINNLQSIRDTYGETLLYPSTSLSGTTAIKLKLIQTNGEAFIGAGLNPIVSFAYKDF